MYIDHNNKLVFIHVSRTGGSSIKTALNLHDKQYNEHYHLDSSYIPKECKDYFKFAFVRNPFDRFVSLYHFRPKGLSFSDWLDNITLTYIQQVDYGIVFNFSLLQLLYKASHHKRYTKILHSE